MQQRLRRLAKSLVGYRRYMPAPAYNGLRQMYRKMGMFPYLKAPAEFDAAFYLQTVPQDKLRGLTPYAHFVRYGQQELRNPSQDFDIVWYLHKYGHTFDPNKIDPFSHFIKIGKKQGHAPHPPRHVKFDESKSHTFTSQPRRACLFAGYDPDGRIDDYVIIYIKELSRHADVFFLADNDMSESELAKLDGITKGAWSIRHGAYDFGSYRTLARDLVGWDILSAYDEVIFANDSCYLIRPLDDVFRQMNKESCAFWGLQATKGLVSTIGKQPFPVEQDSMSIDAVKARYLDQFELDQTYDFHIGSYFVVYRNSIITDTRFQRIVNSIQTEPRKANIIKKYEIGFTRFLIGCGYEFATYGRTLTKFHPVYSDTIYDLIRDGFPLFKRFMIAENHYRMSSLAYWKVVLNQADTVTAIEKIEENYLRVSSAEKLHRNFRVINDGNPIEPTLSPDEFTAYDKTTPVHDRYWGFLTNSSDHELPRSVQAVLESIQDDPEIVKIVFLRSRSLRFVGRNIISVPLRSREGQSYLARCRNIFRGHGSEADLHWPIDEGKHRIFDLQNDDLSEITGAIGQDLQILKGIGGHHVRDATERGSSINRSRESVIFLQAEGIDRVYQSRIFALSFQLKTMGWQSQVVKTNSVQIDLFDNPEFVVFCGLEMSPQTLDLVERIRNTGGKVIYDTNTLVHDDDALLESEYFMRDPKRSNALMEHSRLRAQLMMLVDGFTVTTPALCASVSTFEKPVSIVDDCLPASLIQKYRGLSKPRLNDQIHLSFIADLGAFANDFDACRAALFDFMRLRSEIVLHLVGPMDGYDYEVPTALDRRVRRHGLMSGDAMHDLLHTMDINLAPLADTAFNDSQSAVRVVEAALHAVPTIASPSAPHRETISDRVTGYLARTHQDWQEALQDAVDHCDARLEIGEGARRQIVPRFTVDNAAKQLTAFLTRNW